MTTFARMIEEKDYPRAEISNGVVSAGVFLPDAEKGFYRGTRFERSGAIYSLQWQGHEYFGPWREGLDDPTQHDNIMGPAESFSANDQVLGYEEAKVGGIFLRIGVGLCEKPEEDGYVWSHTYKVLDPGKWSIRQGSHWIEFTHGISTELGYAYRYTKRLTLTENKPELILSHSLANTGQKVIATEVFNHNFFVIDGQPSSPDFTIELPFSLTADRDLKGVVMLDGKTIRYPAALTDGQIYAFLEGFGAEASDNTFVIRNSKTGAGVRVATNQPLDKVAFWTTRRTICPEPFIFMEIEPGKAYSWNTEYQFFENM